MDKLSKEYLQERIRIILADARRYHKEKDDLQVLVYQVMSLSDIFELIDNKVARELVAPVKERLDEIMDEFEEDELFL